MKRKVLLILAAAAMVAAPATAQQIGGPSDDAALAEQYEQARIDAALANARLSMVSVQMKLQKGQLDQAQLELNAVRASLATLGQGTDISAYSQMADRLQEQIDQARLAQARAPRPQAADVNQPANQPGPGYGDPQVTSPEMPGLQGQVDAAVEQANIGTRETLTAPADSRIAIENDPVIVRQRTLDSQQPWDSGRYAPAQELIDTGKLLELDSTRVHYQYAVSQVRDGSRRDELLHTQEAGVIPPQKMNYPHDWQQISEQRKQYADGVLWKSRTFKDADGKEKYVAAYDVSDLLFVPIFPGPSEYNVRRPTNPLTYWADKPWWPSLYLYGPYSGSYGPGADVLGPRGYRGSGSYYGRGNYDIIPPYYYPFEADPIYQHRLAQRRAWLLQQVNTLLSTTGD